VIVALKAGVLKIRVPIDRVIRCLTLRKVMLLHKIFKLVWKSLVLQHKLHRTRSFVLKFRIFLSFKDKFYNIPERSASFILFRLFRNVSEEIKIRLLFIFRLCLYIILITLN
jgi:hypothetical protein